MGEACFSKNENLSNDERWEPGRFLLWPTCGVVGLSFNEPSQVAVEATAVLCIAKGRISQCKAMQTYVRKRRGRTGPCANISVGSDRRSVPRSSRLDESDLDAVSVCAGSRSPSSSLWRLGSIRSSRASACHTEICLCPDGLRAAQALVCVALLGLPATWWPPPSVSFESEVSKRQRGQSQARKQERGLESRRR